MTSRPLLIGGLYYYGWELLDVQGPMSVLLKMASHSQQQVVFVTVGPVEGGSVESTAHQPVVAHHSYATCPPLDVLVVPGGIGSFVAAKDTALLDFVEEVAHTATLVASVCSGSSILAAAGLLDGRRATSNKAWFGPMAAYGSNVDYIHDARFVEDGKFVTASGVSAGLDMAFVLGEKLFGKAIADKVAKQTFYTPLGNAHDPFAKIHPRPSSWFGYLHCLGLSLLAPYLVPLETEKPASASSKDADLSILLFPHFDTLDLAGVLESLLPLSKSHKFELIAVNPAPVSTEQSNLIIQIGGDSTSSNSSYSSALRVVCDREITDSTAPESFFPNTEGRPRIIYIPNSTHIDSIAAKNVFEELQLFDFASRPDSDSRILVSGRSVIAALEKALKKPLIRALDQSIRTHSRSHPGWGRVDRVLVAESGLCGVTAALEIVQEVAGEAAAKHSVIMMEIAPQLMPEGMTLE
ncbi:class I glutamine amidotransferase-like protein [Rhizoclosmatium globosum]|uniref:Class I glutamine amidotransferase-like protein n=1 Tax=Rhizoclosmatium globosum TaxID=329046 RepID=A0A1Y2BMF7_9FUNG|nr:class I glutamine amidotransferase-like protein [Rhizoclosmatium globosum]|eukprot:ORY35946.1 class I glutamine amidotransferase-like protein [Rhizoclosmatium globosum]